MIIGKHKYNQNQVVNPNPVDSDLLARMRESLSPLQHSEGPGEPPFGDNYEPARVRFGIYNRILTAYLTVGEFRDMYTRAWRIPTDAVAYSGQHVLTDDYLIQPGDVIEFYRRMERRGRRR